MAPTRTDERISCAASIAQSCYLAFIAILSALKALGFYDGQSVFTLFMVIACLFLLAKLALTEYTFSEYIAIIVLLGMGVLVYFNTGEKSLLIIMMLLVGIKGVPVRKVMRTFLAVWGIGFVFLTFVSLIGLNTETILMHDKTGIGYVICHTLGYSHSNVLHMNFLCISAMVLYLAKDRFTRRRQMALLALLIALDLYVFLYSMSYTGLLGTAALYLFYAYFMMRGRLGRAERVLAQLVLPVCLAFSLIGPLVIKGGLFDLINSLLTTRYSLTLYFLTEQPVTPFGTRFEVPNYRYTLDCSYAYLFMQLGVIPFIVLMLLYAGAIRRMVKENRLTELAVTLGLCVGGVAEPFLFNFGFKNVSLVFIGEYLYYLLGRVSERFGWSGKARSPVSFLGSLAGTITSGRRAGSCSGSNDCPVRRMACRAGVIVSYPVRWCGTVCHLGRSVLQHWMENARRYFLIAAAVFTLAAGAAALITPDIPAVYVNSTVNEEARADRTHFYLDEEEVEELRAEGNLVFGYIDENEAMYPYDGTAAAFEYWRIVASWGVWTAAAVSLVLAGYELRKCRKTRT